MRCFVDHVKMALRVLLGTVRLRPVNAVVAALELFSEDSVEGNFRISCYRYFCITCQHSNSPVLSRIFRIL